MSKTKIVLVVITLVIVGFFGFVVIESNPSLFMGKTVLPIDPVKSESKEVKCGKGTEEINGICVVTLADPTIDPEPNPTMDPESNPTPDEVLDYYFKILTDEAYKEYYYLDENCSDYTFNQRYALSLSVGGTDGIKRVLENEYISNINEKREKGEIVFDELIYDQKNRDLHRKFLKDVNFWLLCESIPVEKPEP